MTDFTHDTLFLIHTFKIMIILSIIIKSDLDFFLKKNLHHLSDLEE